ncbi:hypothetical protein [Streptomyces spectabilis]
MKHPHAIEPSGPGQAVLYCNLHYLTAEERRAQMAALHAFAETASLPVRFSLMDDCPPGTAGGSRPGWRRVTELVQAPQPLVRTVVCPSTYDLADDEAELTRWAEETGCTLIEAGPAINVEDTFPKIKAALHLQDPCDPHTFRALRDGLLADLYRLTGIRFLRDSDEEIIQEAWGRAHRMLREHATPRLNESAFDHLVDLAWSTRCLACLYRYRNADTARSEAAP